MLRGVPKEASVTEAEGPTLGDARFVVLVLASGQFLMTLDSSVMNVSMAQVADDLNTPITGIQTAITLYTLVMASLMITGGKFGSILGRRRAFNIGLVIYGIGSFTTSLAPNLTVLLVGWSLLEGIGAALIMPAIVALVASNVEPARRGAAYGIVAAAGAIAVAAGPLIGGAVTTFASWRYVFAGEVVIVVLILAVSRKIRDAETTPVHLDYVGSLLSIVGLSTIVFGVLRSSEWGFIRPKPDAPQILGVSPVLWLITGGLLVLYFLLQWEYRLLAHHKEPLVDPNMFRNLQLRGGLTMFFFQFMIQAGVFFAVPLFLSVVLELSALQTGLRILPLSISLLIAAAGIPKVWPRANPRRVVRVGLFLMIVGILILAAGMDPGVDASVVALPMLLMGFGLGALASQLGAVTVSSMPDDNAPEVGGLQNTATNLGASLGTALIGSVLIGALTTAALAGIEGNDQIPADIQQQATTNLASGVPFMSDTQLDDALTEAGVSDETAAEVMQINSDARLEALQIAFGAAAIIAIIGLFMTGMLPERQPGTDDAEESSISV
jgi:EmrB/QacA subfamily drug resistance transporter